MINKVWSLFDKFWFLCIIVGMFFVILVGFFLFVCFWMCVEILLFVLLKLGRVLMYNMMIDKIIISSINMLISWVVMLEFGFLKNFYIIFWYLLVGRIILEGFIDSEIFLGSKRYCNRLKNCNFFISRLFGICLGWKNFLVVW